MREFGHPCRVSDRAPEEIWDEGLREGERRLERSWPALAATGFAGGADVMFGIVAVMVADAGLSTMMPDAAAHVLASLLFGLGFVFITIGRAELFTENFLIPVGTVFAGRERVVTLVRMWVITLGLNFVGLALLGAMVSVKGVLPPGTLHAAGLTADTLGERSFLPALLSAVVAGAIMTSFTWITSAAESATSRIVVALLVGFVLAAPTLNHAVVGFGEMILGLFAGTTHSSWLDLVRNVSVAVLGNVIGGVGLVFTTRLAQVSGDPVDGSGKGRAHRQDRGDP
jgi:formate/nitrite transporter FocA (FNT family)